MVLFLCRGIEEENGMEQQEKIKIMRYRLEKSYSTLQDYTTITQDDKIEIVLGEILRILESLLGEL